MDYQLLTVKDVASILTIGTRSVLDLIRDGELAAVKINARTYRVTPKALEDFLAKNSTATQARTRQPSSGGIQGCNVAPQNYSTQWRAAVRSGSVPE